MHDWVVGGNAEGVLHCRNSVIYFACFLKTNSDIVAGRNIIGIVSEHLLVSIDRFSEPPEAEKNLTKL